MDSDNGTLTEDLKADPKTEEFPLTGLPGGPDGAPALEPGSLKELIEEIEEAEENAGGDPASALDDDPNDEEDGDPSADDPC
jgi:hypothetical protein